MEKESLIASLKERIGETDFNAISRRSVETIIEPMLPLFADDEKVTEETYALPVAMLKSFIGQSRHDIAEAIKTEKANFETEKAKAVKDAVDAYKTSIDPPKKPESPVAQKGEPLDINGIVDQKLNDMIAGLTGDDGAIGKLTKSLNTFISSYNEQRQKETEAEIKTRLISRLEEMGADKPKVIELAIRDVKISEGKDFEDLLKDAKNSYEGLYKELYANGPQPFSGGGGEASDNSFKDFIGRQQELAKRQEEDAKALRTKMI